MRYWKHLKTILKHKWYVGIECFKIGLYWQGIIHDLSKFSLVEFFISAKYFQGNCSPTKMEKIEKEYSIVWLHHKARNKHHWEYWVYIDNNGITLIDIPDKYVLEMVCDMIGTGKAYNNIFRRAEPLFFWENNVNKKYISENTNIKISNYLLSYKIFGKITKLKGYPSDPHSTRNT